MRSYGPKEKVKNRTLEHHKGAAPGCVLELTFVLHDVTTNDLVASC
jgi:hypothetical protein